MPRIRPPFRYYGGKYYLAPWIIGHFCEHTTYLEPFGGAASVLLNKPKATKEVYNDLNQNIVNVMRSIKEDLELLCQRLSEIECEEGTFYRWKSLVCQDVLEQALRTFVIHKMSRGGAGGSFSKSNREYRGLPENAAAWKSGIAELPRISARLQEVEILCQPAVELMKKFDSETALFYLDPPYLRRTRATPWSVYKVEMDVIQHQELLDLAKQCKARILISGYPSELYGTALSNWIRTSKSSCLYSGHTKTESKTKAEECIWKNF